MDMIREWWSVILALLAAVVWLLRLEARGLQNEREIKRLWDQRSEDLEQAQQARDETNAMLKEMRADIKRLLQSANR